MISDDIVHPIARFLDGLLLRHEVERDEAVAVLVGIRP